MTPIVLLVVMGVVIWAHEIAVLRRARNASETLQKNKTWPARESRRATDQHR